MKKNIKKIFLFVTVVVTALVCFAVSASALNATGQCGDNVYWEYNITTDELVISGTGPMTDYENYYSSPFYSSNIKSVVINDGVTTIGDYAFYSCDSLTEVTIGDSVTTIGDRAFYWCDGLTEVTIGDSVTTIGDYAFCYCNSLTKVTIPDSVTTIGGYAFAGDGLGRSSLTKVTIGDSVTTIGDSAFRDCYRLTEVTIPDSVTTIGGSAFCNCESLTEVTIPDSVTTIGDYAFYSCDSLTEVTIGDSVTTIGDRAFYWCDGLTEVVIGDSVTTIGDHAFYCCDSLTKVTIPDSVTTIGDDAFYSCDSLTEVYYGGTQEQWKKISIGSDNGRLTGAKIYFVKSPIQSIYPDEFTTGIDKYPDFKKLMSSYCALPGLKSTVVTDADKNVCYTCNCMTPQGICFAGDYVLISAYCSVETYKDNLTSKILNGDNYDKLSAEKNHSTHKSVIYVINRNKKTLLTTLTLPDKNHVGGLAFDGSNVWIAKSSDKKVSAISLSTIKSAVNSGDEGVAVNYEKTFSCGHTASFVEYFDNKLWVGVFNEEESSYMYGFTFNGGKENVSGLTEVASVAIPAKANGAAFYSNGTKTALIVNSSYGRNNDSKIYLYDVKSALNQKNITINLMTTYIFPTLAEEVVVEGDKLYMIFESAATTYCNVDGNKASAVVDRICEGNAADFNAKIHYVCSEHKNVIDVQEVKPTCKEAGYTSGKYCSDCEMWISGGEKVPKVSHIFTTYTYNNDATYTSDGTKTAYCDFGCGIISTITAHGTKLPLGKTSKITATQTVNSINLSWSPVEGADGYKLFQRIDGKWKDIGIRTVTTSSIKNLKAGTKYTFAVMAGAIVDGKVIWSDTYTTINTATKAAAPKTITSAQNTTAIRLTWSKCPGATGYRIFYKSGNAWKICLNATTATSHTFSGLKAGSKFTFAVRPYIITDSGVIWSDYTTYTASTLPAIPKTAVASPSSGKITVKWNAVSGAEAYQLYYKTGNGAYKLYKNYFSAQTVSFSGLKSGTKYTFAVRAAKNTSGGWVFGSFTPVSVTVK